MSKVSAFNLIDLTALPGQSANAGVCDLETGICTVEPMPPAPIETARIQAIAEVQPTPGTPKPKLPEPKGATAR